MNLATKLQLCQLCTFRAGDLLLGVDVHVVQEVNRFQEMTPVPLSGPGIEGLINLRGEIVTAIDLRRQLGLEARDEEVHPMNVVVRTGGGIACLLVDEIGDLEYAVAYAAQLASIEQDDIRRVALPEAKDLFESFVEDLTGVEAGLHALGFTGVEEELLRELWQVRRMVETGDPIQARMPYSLRIK